MFRGTALPRWTNVLLLLLPLVVGCGGGLCDVLKRDTVRVDGVRLRHRRHVELNATNLSRLEVEAQRGDIMLRGTSGAVARLEVEIYEYRPGDATPRLSRDGQILFETRSGKPAAVGELRGKIPQSLSLDLATGMGAVEICEMRECAAIELSTGMGDILIAECEELRDLEASTGMGDLHLRRSRGLVRAELATGMGGIRVAEAQVRSLEVSSGMGGIKFRDCEFGRVTGGTGMGSIRFRETTYDQSDVSTGMGRVSYD